MSRAGLKIDISEFNISQTILKQNKNISPLYLIQISEYRKGEGYEKERFSRYPGHSRGFSVYFCGKNPQEEWIGIVSSEGTTGVVAMVSGFVERDLSLVK